MRPKQLPFAERMSDMIRGLLAPPRTGARGKPVHWLVRPETIQKLWIVSSLILALTVFADFFIHHHGYFGVDDSFGFNAWYGLLTCAAMVFFAKLLGIFLKRRDDYYDD